MTKPNDSEVEKVTIYYVSDVEGNSLYINDHRVSGPKPWGGGTTIKEWIIDTEDLVESLKPLIRSQVNKARRPLREALKKIEKTSDQFPNSVIISDIWRTASPALTIDTTNYGEINE